LAKSIHQVGWGMFCTMLKYKAETEIPHQSCGAPPPKLSIGLTPLNPPNIREKQKIQFPPLYKGRVRVG
ncbi:hypothetical protein CBP28_08885, partial [Fischerella thermalis WC559]